MFLGANLPSTPHRLTPGVGAIRFRTGISDDVVLPIKVRNEHGTIMLIASRLIGEKKRRLTALRRDISQPLAKAAMAKLSGTTEEFNGIIGAKGRDASLHGAIVFIAERQDVDPHGLSLAFHP